MYISYDRLWKLLIDKHLKKTDLIDLCGISSRTLGKLSKNENINSDTLLRICEALDCDLFDIMELKNDEAQMSFYDVFCREKKLVSTDENCKTYTFEHTGRRVILKKTLKKATKRVIVTCSGHSVSAVHLYPVTHHTVATDHEFHIDVMDMQDKDSIALVVISGKPGLIKGLDEGIFVSASGQAKDKSPVYVMSETRFRSFELPL